MSLAHTRKPGTILGNVIFLIITGVIIFMFISFVSNYQIGRIEKVNNNYLISSNYLVPENYEEYKYTLEELKIEKYTESMIEYIDIIIEARKIDRYLEYSHLETRCVTRKTLAAVDMQIQNKMLLLEKLQYSNSKKLEKIYWNRYIESLKNYPIEEIKIKAQELELC